MAAWAVANLQAQIDETNATVTIHELPAVVADDQLSRVFQNLIENAIKYRGKTAPDIRVRAVKGGRHWLFSVEDNGIGFEMQYSDSIFGVYQRLHDRKIEGTGIGLAVCKKIGGALGRPYMDAIGARQGLHLLFHGSGRSVASSDPESYILYSTL